jgi:Putative addiction module component
MRLSLELTVTPAIPLQSFDTKMLDIEGAWVRESEDRLAAYRAGEMSAMSIDEAMQRIFA